MGQAQNICACPIFTMLHLLHTQVSDLDGNGLKGQKHQAQGKRSDTLGIACWSSRTLKGQKL